MNHWRRGAFDVNEKWTVRTIWPVDESVIHWWWFTTSEEKLTKHPEIFACVCICVIRIIIRRKTNTNMTNWWYTHTRLVNWCIYTNVYTHTHTRLNAYIHAFVQYVCICSDFYTHIFIYDQSYIFLIEKHYLHSRFLPAVCVITAIGSHWSLIGSVQIMWEVATLTVIHWMLYLGPRSGSKTCWTSATCTSEDHSERHWSVIGWWLIHI